MAGKFFQKTLLGITSLGLLASGGIGVSSVLDAAGVINLTTDEEHHYLSEWYNEDTLVYRTSYRRGELVKYEGETPTKTDFSGEKVYTFIGWDTTGDNVPDIPPIQAYGNYKFNACFMETPMDLLEKIDWEKLLELLMDSDIDLEALLTRLGLSLEDIVRLLNLTSFRVKSSAAGPAYLRTESFSNYDKKKNGWKDAGFYDLNNISPGSVNPLLYTSNKLSQLSLNPLFASYTQEATYEFEYLKTGGKYPTVAFETVNTQNIPSDSYSVKEVDSDNKYSTSGYGLIPCTEETVAAGAFINYSSDVIANDEREYRNYVQEHYLDVPDTYRTYFQEFNSTYIHAPSGNIGKTVKLLTDFFTENYSLSLSHNNYPRNKDPLLYFLGTEKEGDPNYFATATTLFLRTLGYPARYTQGYIAPIDAADTWVDITPIHAYSWCEVYVNNIGWMSADTCMYMLAAYMMNMGATEEDNDSLDMSNMGKNNELIRLEAGENTVYEKIGGGTFDYSKDLELVAVFSDGKNETKKVVEPTNTTPVDISQKKGPYTVYPMAFYTYLGVTKYLSYEVNVLPLKVENLNIENETIYYPYSDINFEDFVITADFNDGKTRDIFSLDLNNLTYSNFPTGRDPGTYDVSFTYRDVWGIFGEYTMHHVTIPITIHEPPHMISINPNEILDPIVYAFSKTRLFDISWTAKYSNGDIDYDYYLRPEDILNPEVLRLDEERNFTAVIQPDPACEPYFYSFDVIEDTIVSCEIYSQPEFRYIYRTGEKLNCLDFEIAATKLSGKIDYINQDIVEVNHDPLIEEKEYPVSLSFVEETYFHGNISHELDTLIPIKFVRATSIKVNDNAYISKECCYEISEEDFFGLEFVIAFDDGTTWYVDGYDGYFTYDFSSINIEEVGVQYATATFNYSDFVEPISCEVEVRITGLKDFVGHFEGIPEKVYTDRDYSYLDWNIYGTATISYDGINSFDVDVIPNNVPNCQINLLYPHMFETEDEFEITISYTYGLKTLEDSTIINPIRRRVEKVTFDVSSLDQKSFRDIDNVDISKITATVDYNDDTTETFNVYNGILLEAEITTTNEYLCTYTYLATITLDGEDYQKRFTVYVYFPNELVLDTDLVQKDFEVDEPINIANLEAKLSYGHGLESVAVDAGSLDASLEGPRVVGENSIKVEYDYCGHNYSASYKVYLYEVKIVFDKDAGPFLEGETFNPTSLGATIVFDTVEGREQESMDAWESGRFGAANGPFVIAGGTNYALYIYSHESYKEITYTFESYVLDSLEIDTTGAKTAYLRKDDENYDGLKINAVYKQESTGKIVKREISFDSCGIIEGIDTSSLGTKSCKLAYSIGFHLVVGTFSYTVSEPKIIGFTVNSSEESHTTAYLSINGGLTNAFDLAGATFTIVYENGKTETYPLPDTSDDVQYDFFKLSRDNPFGILSDDDYVVQDYYQNFTISHPVGDDNEQKTSSVKFQVLESRVVRLSLDSSQCKTDFFKRYKGGADEQFSYEGLVAYVHTDYDYTHPIKVDDIDSVLTVDTPTLEEGQIDVCVRVKPEFTGGENVSDYYTISCYEDRITQAYASYTHTNYSGTTGEFIGGTTVNVNDQFDLNAVNYYGIYKSTAMGYGDYPPLGYDTEFSGGFTVNVISYPDFSTPGTTSLEVTLDYEGYSIAVDPFTFEVRAESKEIEYMWAEENEVEVKAGDSDGLSQALSELTFFNHTQKGKDVQLSNSEYEIVSNNVDINVEGTYCVEYLYTGEDKTSHDVTCIITVVVVDHLDINYIDVSFQQDTFALGSDTSNINIEDLTIVTVSFTSPNVSPIQFIGGGTQTINHNGETHTITVFIQTSGYISTDKEGSYTAEVFIIYSFDGEKNYFSYTYVYEVTSKWNTTSM